jgi:mRNA interferase RelE/StbE
MSYNLKFHKKALKEWEKINPPIREQLKKKLAQRLLQPRVPADQLHGTKDRYKIKLRSSGYRLVYEVNDQEIYILVLVIANRDTVYTILDAR